MGKVYQKKDRVINYSGSHAVVEIFEKRRRRNIRYYLFSVGETLNADSASQARPTCRSLLHLYFKQSSSKI
jgi:hypothetical protein